MNNKKVLNLYGEKCSTIINRITSQIERLDHGDSILVKTDNVCACKKIPNWCRLKNYSVTSEKIDKYSMHFTIRV